MVATGTQQSWFGKLKLFVSLTMLVLSSWGGYCCFYRPSLAAAVCISCGLTCLVIQFLLKESDERDGTLAAIVLGCFAIIGAFGSSESVSQLIPLGEGSFVNSNGERWEVVALSSTAFMALLYFDSVETIKGGFTGSNRITPLLAGLVGSIVCIIFALHFVHQPLPHYLFVISAACLFCVVDWHTYQCLVGSSDAEMHRRGVGAKMVLMILDVPVVIGLIVMSGYFYYLQCEPDVMSRMIGPVTFEAALGNACLEAYPFLAGALAFQMISFNVIYVAFAFRLHEVHSKGLGGQGEQTS